MRTQVKLLLTAGLLIVTTACQGPFVSERAAAPVAFVAYDPAADFQLPAIVLQYDPATKSGANWAEVSSPKWHEATDPVLLGRAANYLRDGLQRMTGKSFPVVSTKDLSRGMVLTLLNGATEDIRTDPEVRRALKADPQDQYAANEAFYIRSEKDRVLVVANTPWGLIDAVAELLESVDYEVLGMGPNWIYAPDHRDKPLVFAVNRAGRPSFYIRQLWAHSGQSYGVGTIMSGLTDPADEPVDVSYWRWSIGTRLAAKSMPPFAGHALQAYHRKIMDRMRDTGSPHGFLADVRTGLDKDRPPAAAPIKGLWWINTDPKGTPGFDQIQVCDGATWKLLDHPKYFGSNVDVSAPIVREVVFEDMQLKSVAHFKTNPDDPFIFTIEPEDGGVADAERLRTLADAQWYPEYRAREKLPLGRRYALHGYNGLDQPRETWDPASASDHVFGFAGYLLHEYDKWIDSLPEEERVTSTGRSKKQLVRCNLSSYNQHDVPPNFNPDHRIRVMIAPFPKHRGTGKWERFITQEDMAKAFQVMLPGEPSADYSFYSFSYYNDGGPNGVAANWSASPVAIAGVYHRAYAVGIRSISREIDLNFGKHGLGYYLVSKVLWNVGLTTDDLGAIRDRWFERSFGSAWTQMKAYYDFMLPENYPANSPNIWAQAIRLIDAADRKIDPVKEPQAQQRIDDVKLYWYSHYLMDSGLFSKDSPEVRTFLWKGQMSYMVGMQGLLGRDFDRAPALKAAGPEISAGPAHYTHDQVQAWWPKVLDFWQVTPVSLFAQATLANGQPARSVDLNDLVLVDQFQTDIPDAPFLYNSAYMKRGTFLTVADAKDDPIGFRLTWPFNPNDHNYDAMRVPYGVDAWDRSSRSWTTWIDPTTTAQTSAPVALATGRTLQLVEVQLKAPRPGVYRFTLGAGGNLALLASPACDPATGKYARRLGFTYYTQAHGLTQGGVYLYIPKGTRSLDMEVWDTSKVKFVTLFRGLPKTGLTRSRKVDIGAMGAHTIALEPGEDGSLALVEGNNFFFPYLYSVPTLWAKSPAALLVPRAIALADGLTITGAAAATRE